MLNYRKIEVGDDARLAEIIRAIYLTDWAKAMERSLSGWRKTGRERRATVICILKLTRISKRR